jgi:hypothetical protein
LYRVQQLIVGRILESEIMIQNQPTATRQTDIFAILCLATGLVSLLLLPIVLVPACFICCLISHFRLKENPNLKGQGLRIAGWILGVISCLYLLLVYHVCSLNPY